MSWDQQLEGDLKWREREMAALKFALLQTAPGTAPHSALLRGMWALLYAHYEGFCLFAINLLLDEIKRSCVVRGHCDERLVCFSLEKQFRNIRKSTPPTSDFHAFCRTDYPALISLPIDFEVDKDGEYVLSGRSNLWGDQLLEHCKTLSLSHSHIDSNLKKLGFLVARRNRIAHGRQEVVKDLAEYKQYEDSAILVMHDLAVSIVDALERKSYLKPEYR